MAETSSGAPFHMEKPIILLAPSNSDGRKRFALNPKAVALLQRVKEPISVVSTIGNQRGGKSTLMNLLFSRELSGGFGIGHFMEPKTSGLWLWLRRHPKNPDSMIAFIDTEGCFPLLNFSNFLILFLKVFRLLNRVSYMTGRLLLLHCSYQICIFSRCIFSSYSQSV